MALKKLRVLVASALLLGACGGDDGGAEPSPTDETTDAGSTTPKPGKADAGKTQKDAATEPTDPDEPSDSDAGTDPGTPDDPADTADSGTPGEPVSTKCDYSDQDVKLTKDLVVPAGKTVHVCAGTNFLASKDVKIDVLGTLIADGTADAPVTFMGTAADVRSWHGIVIESGGNLKLTHGKVGGAIYGMYAMKGSDFTVDSSQFGTSFKTAIVMSDGKFTNITFAASPPPTIAITDAVTVDDPNGSVTILDASPSFSNCAFDGASGFTDVVRVGGESAATFDHVYLHNAHCGFHTSGGTNTSIHVTNSVFKNLAYGIMAYATKPIIEDSVFGSNTNDVGQCTGATKDNTPVLKNNNYAKGSPVIDASCFSIGTTDASPAATANPSAGPSGL